MKSAFLANMTLHTLQDKIKRQPELYKKEFNTHFQIFKELLNNLKENPAKKDDRMEDYLKFMAHISAVYKDEIGEFLSSEIINVLQQYFSILNPSIRMTLVTCLKIMRGKDVVTPGVVLPVLLKLFRCDDKSLRKFIHVVVVQDMKKLNQTHKVVNINRKLQNFIYTMVQDPNEGASRRSLNVMIELYKRKIWNDDKTVNVISEGCFSNNPKIVVSACKFFLTLDYDYDSDSDSEEDEHKKDKIALLKERTKSKKMTKNRESKLDRAIKQEKRKQNRKGLVKFSTDFLPIDLIFDPPAFTEKLFSKLKKSNDIYEVKLYMLRLISRMIGRHKIQLLQFYPNLIRYLNSHNKDKIGEIFAMVIESCHNLIPPETIRPVLEKIISNYVTEYCNNSNITVGLNAIREILMRMPLALDEGQIEYLCSFRTFKNKSVSAAAKSLVNYFRDVCPELLPKKMRGRFTTIDEENALENMAFGAERVNFDIDGIDLLKKVEKIDHDVNLATERILDDKDLKKIKILQLKEGVKRVDRHGFKDAAEGRDTEVDAARDAIRSEYYHKLVELMSKRRNVPYVNTDEAMGSEDDSDAEEGEAELEDGYMAAEEGEAEMDDEEGEMEDDEEAEGADEWVSGGEEDSDGSDIPEAVPIDRNTTVNVNHEHKESDVSDISDVDVDDYSSSEDYDSDDLDVDTTANPHGFVFSNMLNTYSHSRKERIALMREDYDKESWRDKFKKKKQSKNIGKSERVHQKNKPFMMIKQKKIHALHDNMKKLNERKRTTKRFLGHYSKATKQRLESKKKGNK